MIEDDKQNRVQSSPAGVVGLGLEYLRPTFRRIRQEFSNTPIFYDSIKNTVREMQNYNCV